MAIGNWEMGGVGFHPNSLDVRNISTLHEGVQQTVLDDPASTCHIFDYDGTLRRNHLVLSKIQGDSLVYTARPFVGLLLRRKLRQQRESLDIIAGLEKIVSQRRLLDYVNREMDKGIRVFNYYGNSIVDDVAIGAVAQNAARRNTSIQVRYFRLGR